MTISIPHLFHHIYPDDSDCPGPISEEHFPNTTLPTCAGERGFRHKTGSLTIVVLHHPAEAAKYD